MSKAPYPILCTAASIISLIFSTYFVKSRDVTMTHVYIGTFLSFTPLLLTTASSTRKLEVLWWLTPLSTFLMNTAAVYWIRESEMNMRDLEKLKYKYKGA
jgi:hypothetical protein